MCLCACVCVFTIFWIRENKKKKEIFFLDNQEKLFWNLYSSTHREIRDEKTFRTWALTSHSGRHSNCSVYYIHSSVQLLQCSKAHYYFLPPYTLSLCSRYFLSLSCVFFLVFNYTLHRCGVYISLCIVCLCYTSFPSSSSSFVCDRCVLQREKKKKTRGGKWWGEEGTIWATILNSSIGSGRLFDFFFFFSLLYIFILFSLLFSSATRVRRKNTLSLCVYIKDALPTKRRWRVYIHKTIEPIKLSCAIVYNPAASRPFFFFFFLF